MSDRYCKCGFLFYDGMTHEAKLAHAPCHADRGVHDLAVMADTRFFEQVDESVDRS